MALENIYYVVTGAATARRAPEILSRLIELGPRVVTMMTPNASRILAPREITIAIEGHPRHRLVESYFDEAIVPRPPRGLVLVAPCSFDALNKIAQGIADNLALSVVAEAIGRRTPVLVGVSVNVPLWAHPRAQSSVAALREWGVHVIDPVPSGEAILLAPTETLVEEVRRHLHDV